MSHATKSLDAARQRAKKLSLFRDVEADSTDQLLATGREERRDKGSILLHASDSSLKYSIILDGWAGARKSNDEGQESILHIFGVGAFFPDFGTGGRAMGAEIAALTDLWLFTIPIAALQESAQRSPALAANMLAEMSRRSEELRDHVEQLTLHSALHRIGWFLLKLRVETRAGLEITLPFEKSVIASYLGITPETLSRSLTHFREQGFTSARHAVSLPDDYALCDYCDARLAQDCPHAETPECAQSDIVDPV